MELVDITVSPVQSMAGVVWVRCADLARQQRGRGAPVRPLVPGDDVMVRVDEGTVLRGRVLRYAGTGREAAYAIMFGGSLGRMSPLRLTEPA